MALGTEGKVEMVPLAVTPCDLLEAPVLPISTHWGPFDKRSLISKGIIGFHQETQQELQ